MIVFTRGVPPPDAFPTQQLQECAAAILNKDANIVLQYHPAAGYAPLREWLAQRYDTQPNQVLVSNGSLQLQQLFSQWALEPGDTVFVERPSYDRAITVFSKAQACVVGIPMEADGFSVSGLRELLEENVPKFMYIIPDFQNPSGITTSLTKRKALVDLAEEYGFWILEDNPYRELRYYGEFIPSLVSLGSDRVVHLSSFSKLLSPGMRVGYLIGPRDLVGKLTKMAEETYLAPNMLSQGIVYEYCERGWMDPNIERLRDLYRPRLEAILNSLEQESPTAVYAKPEGGFFLGVNLPGVNTSALRVRALQHNLQLSDSQGFFPSRDGDSFLRLPFCALSPQEIVDGVKRLSVLAHELATEQ